MLRKMIQIRRFKERVERLVPQRVSVIFVCEEAFDTIDAPVSYCFTGHAHSIFDELEQAYMRNAHKIIEAAKRLVE